MEIRGSFCVLSNILLTMIQAELGMAERHLEYISTIHLFKSDASSVWVVVVVVLDKKGI